MSVSRSLKILCDNKRAPNWFSQKSCAAQYVKLLENVETPKWKKRIASERDSSTPVETPGESIVRKLIQERVMELKQIMLEEQQEFQKLKEEILLMQSSHATEAQIRQMWAEIEDENRQREVEKANHDEWLKKREQRKLEMERAWRPGLAFHGTKSPQKAAQLKQQQQQVAKQQQQTQKAVEEMDTEELSRNSGQSPLLTSLLKSPSTSTSVASLLQTPTTPTSSRINTSDTQQSHQQQLQQSQQQQQSIPMNIDSPQPDAINEIFPDQISSVESGDPKDDDQLMEVFKQLIPDNIEELADILTDNNEIIPELLKEEKILIEGEESAESNLEPKLYAFDQLKNETIREERKKKEMAALL